MKKSKKIKHKKKGKDERLISNRIIGVFSSNPTKLFNYKQVAKKLELKSTEHKMIIIKLLGSLTADGKLIEMSKGKYRIVSTAGYILGKVDLAKAGYGFVVPEDGSDDVFISQKNLNSAMGGDSVKVYCFARRKGSKTEGEVVEILQRAKINFVGVIEKQNNFAFLIPDSKTAFDLFIPFEKLNGANHGDKAIARITDWSKKAKNPYAEIIEVLGKPGNNDVEMHAILAEYDLPVLFKKLLEEEADKIPDEIPKDEIKNRRDFRNITTFTIDPVDAKDFDDALSFKKLDNGNWEVGVHIADVTHYIKPKTLLDNEAYERATSVYLVDRVVPMLPEKISNKICSLRPNEDKLCFSAVFEINEDAATVNQWFGRTIINSDKRFTYEEAQEVIETNKGVLSEELFVLNTIAKKLRTRRFKHGSIAFERLEVKFDIDEDGKPLGVYYKEHKDSNQLIEEFMLLANKRVAQFIGKPAPLKKPKTFVYRVHDKPNLEKLEKFNNFIKKFGHSLQLSNSNNISGSLNELLENVKGKKEQNVIETLAVRSMAKAEYTTINIGHYGLSFNYYTHFTSPIRRYPDMMVHRMLDAYLNGEKSKNKDKYEDMCQHSSERERLAVEAERASVKYKQIEFMQDKIGNIYTGIVSGVTNFGLFVELEENKCEGLVAIRDLGDDFYDLDENNYCLVGKNSKKTFQLGDLLKVKVKRADLLKRHLDFILEENEDV